MTPNTILWIYITLLVLGGLMGLLKGKSKISLIMSLAFALPLALCALHLIDFFYDWRKTVNGQTTLHLHVELADLIIAFLLLFFGLRFIKGRKFMPAGLMSIASPAATSFCAVMVSCFISPSVLRSTFQPEPEGGANTSVIAIFFDFVGFAPFVIASGSAML